MDNQYLHRDVLKIFPWLKPRTLISWSERGLIKADFGEASGRGSSRVFSYSNLIEIGILSELLQNGIPFAIIKLITESSHMKDIISKRSFDKIILFQRQLVSSNVPMDKAAPWVGSCGSSTVADFLKNGRPLLSNATTLIVLNVESIKRFIDSQIKKAT
jgi:DNA-binding transcriptional MerR regulator